MQINSLRLCAPDPNRCESATRTSLLGTHQYDYTTNGRTQSLARTFENVSVFQEGEGVFEHAIQESAMVVEAGDVTSLIELNHGTLNFSIFADGVLQSGLTHILPKSGLTALATMIKMDANFPNSIRDIDEDLIVNAIANRKPNQVLSYKGLSFESAFERSVVRWIRSGFSEFRTQLSKVRGRDWPNSINKILVGGGAAPLTQYWIQWIMANAAERRNSGEQVEVENALVMELMAKSITICPNNRFANALGMLHLEPETENGFELSVDFGYSAVKYATREGGVGMMASAIAIPYGVVNRKDIRTGSCLIELRGGALFDSLSKSGQPTSYIFGPAANSIIGAERVISNSKEQYIPHAVLAVCSPNLVPAVQAKSIAATTAR